MTSSAVASRYANALVDVVTGKGADATAQQTVAELRSFQDATDSSAELRHALSSPAVALGRKKAVIGRLAGALGISRIGRNFLFVLVDHRRIPALREILDEFEVALDARLGFSRAEIVSARELNPEQRSALEAELSRLTGKQIRSKFSVDTSLIGGIVARLGSTVYDGSVKGRLESLGRRLTAE